MPKEYSRIDRVADLIQREVSQLILREIRDPRLGMVTISAVHVSKDLGHAKIYITVLGEKEKISQTVDILNKSAGHLRTLLARKLTFRVTPQLRFVYDSFIIHASKLSSLIDEAVKKEDEKKHNE